jgi:hypothetical protein
MDLYVSHGDSDKAVILPQNEKKSFTVFWSALAAMLLTNTPLFKLLSVVLSLIQKNLQITQSFCFFRVFSSIFTVQHTQKLVVVCIAR